MPNTVENNTPEIELNDSLNNEADHTLSIIEKHGKEYVDELKDMIDEDEELNSQLLQGIKKDINENPLTKDKAEVYSKLLKKLTIDKDNTDYLRVQTQLDQIINAKYKAKNLEKNELNENAILQIDAVLDVINQGETLEKKAGYIMTLLKKFPLKESKDQEIRNTIINKLGQDFTGSPKGKIIVDIVKNENNSYETRKSIQYPENYKEAATVGINNIPKELKNHLTGLQESYQTSITKRENELIIPSLTKREALGVTYDNNSGKLKIGNQEYNLFDIDTETRTRKHKIEFTQENPYTLTIDGEEISINPKQEPETLNNENINSYIGLLELEATSPDKTKIQEFIDNQTDPLDSVTKANIIKLLQIAKRKDAVNGEYYNNTLNTIRGIQTNEQIQKKQETLQTQAINFLSKAPTSAEAHELFENNKDLANQILSMIIDDNQERSESQQDNIIALVNNYIGGLVDELKDKPLSFENIKNNIKKGSDLDRRPSNYKGNEVYVIVLEKNNSGKVIEIFPGKMDELHEARSLQTTKEENSEYRTDAIQSGKKEDITAFIKKFDENGSYMTFKDALQKQSSKYLKNNFKTILESIQEAHKEGIDGADEKINGYYEVLVRETTKLTGENPDDISTLNTYLTYIQQNPSYIGTNQEAQIKNRNILALYGDKFIKESNNPAHEETKKLYLACKELIDPNGKTDMIKQIADNVDKFFETFGPMITKLMELFGYSKSDILKKLPQSVRGKFLEQFQELNAMTAEQKKNYNTIKGSIQIKDGEKERYITEDGTLTEKTDTTNPEDINNDKNKPHLLAQKIINDVAENKVDTIRTGLTKHNNFKLLSPSLIQTLIKAHNKDDKSAQISQDQFILNGKIQIKENDQQRQTNKNKLITRLTNPQSDMRKDIYNTHNMIQKNKSINLGTEKEPVMEDINGTKEKRTITTYNDVSQYIAAYAVTFDKPPFRHAMAENNLNIDYEEPKEKTDDEKNLKEYNNSLAKITNILKDGKYTINSNPTELPINYTIDGGFDKYESDVLQPLQELLSEDVFDRTTKSDLLNEVQKRPQVLKDLLTYIAKGKTDPEKSELTELANKFMSDATPAALETIQTVAKNDDGNIEVTITDNKKITIKPGPIFEEVEVTI